MPLVLRKKGYFTAVSQAPAPTEITSINGQPNTGPITVENAQASVLIVGNGFGSGGGVVTWDDVPLVNLGWADTQVEVAFADVPFNPDFTTRDMGFSATLNVIAAAGTAAATITVIPAVSADYDVIASQNPPSIWANDTGIELGVDKGYLRVISGAIDSFSASTGLVDGATDGAQLEYTVYDVSELTWVARAVDTFTAV